MFAKVAGGFSITGVQVTTDLTPIALTLAVPSTALKDVNAAVPDIFNCNCGLKKCVYR
jgi:hypothetical protein